MAKKTSKRQTCRQMYKVKRKVSEATRKNHKNAKKNPVVKSKPKKDPGIPSLFPLKAKVLEEIQERKELLEQQRLARQASNVRQPAANASKQKPAANPEECELIPAPAGTAGQHQKSYYRELNKVIERADVVLQVLDARDPLGTRARHVEDMLRSGTRAPKIVLVLNKTDLVPREVVQDWLTLLRRELPTVAFKANTQAQRSNLGRGAVSVETASDKQMHSSETLGAEAIMHVLKNYARNVGSGIKSGISVGVIGYPNVGKSSLINSLKRARVCAVGATPGITRVMQEIHLDKHIRLLDCPGIIFAPLREGMTEVEKSELMLRNCVRVEALEDPVRPVALIVARAAPAALEVLYCVPPFKSCDEFLAQVARVRGRLQRGGVPDIVEAARSVLVDWNRGRIPFYTKPPVVPVSGERVLVNQMTKALDIDALGEFDYDADVARLAEGEQMGIDFVALSAVHEIGSRDMHTLQPVMCIGAEQEAMEIE